MLTLCALLLVVTTGRAAPPFLLPHPIPAGSDHDSEVDKVATSASAAVSGIGKAVSVASGSADDRAAVGVAAAGGAAASNGLVAVISDGKGAVAVLPEPSKRKSSRHQTLTVTVLSDTPLSKGRVNTIQVSRADREASRAVELGPGDTVSVRERQDTRIGQHRHTEAKFSAPGVLTTTESTDRRTRKDHERRTTVISGPAPHDVVEEHVSERGKARRSPGIRRRRPRKRHLDPRPGPHITEVSTSSDDPLIVREVSAGAAVDQDAEAESAGQVVVSSSPSVGSASSDVAGASVGSQHVDLADGTAADTSQAAAATSQVAHGGSAGVVVGGGATSKVTHED